MRSLSPVQEQMLEPELPIKDPRFIPSDALPPQRVAWGALNLKVLLDLAKIPLVQQSPFLKAFSVSPGVNFHYIYKYMHI